MPKSKAKKFFDSEKNVREYIDSCEGKDSGFLIKILNQHLPTNSRVLELGMGSGADLDILSKKFVVTGSDYSKIFLNIYKEKKPNADLLLLDAATLETNRKFDCIYSNKVLHHLSKDNLKKSLIRQKNLLDDNGILFHTFWNGSKEDKFQDLHFVQYKIDELKNLIQKNFKLIKIDTYQELISDDSIYIIFSPISYIP